MPRTRGLGKETTKKVLKSKVVAVRTASPKRRKEKGQSKKRETEETAYERLCRKVQEKRKKEAESGNNPGDVSVTKKQKIQEDEENEVAGAKFIEDDNFIDMDVSDMHQVFPSEEDDNEEEGEITEMLNISQNNNAAIQPNCNN